MNVLSFDVGTKNLALCHMIVRPTDFEVKQWSVESCVDSSINVNLTPVSDLAPLFYEFLLKSKWTSLEGINVIFIENQPMGLRGSARNLKTKILSHILQVVLKHNMPQAEIFFVNPSLKLKGMVREGPSSYKDNKKYAVSKTSELIGTAECLNADECVTIFAKEKKKDDLADSFLQGLLGARMHLAGNVVESVPKAAKAKAAKEAAKGPKEAKAPKAAKEPKAKEPKTAKKPKTAKVLEESITIEH